MTDSHVVRSGGGAGGHVTLSDGNHLGVVSVTNSDNFVVKWFAVTPGSPTTSCVQVAHYCNKLFYSNHLYYYTSILNFLYWFYTYSTYSCSCEFPCS